MKTGGKKELGCRSSIFFERVTPSTSKKPDRKKVERVEGTKD